MGYEKEWKHAVDGVGGHSGVARFCWLFGVIFLILGIVSDAINRTLGLESISWFLLAIGLFAAGILLMFFWAVGMYLHATGAESKKEE